MKPVYYQTQHIVSQEIGDLIVQGFDARRAPPVSLLPGLAITYGILRRTGEIIKQAEALGRDYLYVDHSYFAAYRNDKVGPNHGYYRIVWNNRYAASPAKPCPPDRFQKLNLDICDWRRDGDQIVVVPMSHYVAAFVGTDANAWLNAVVGHLARLTDRDIVIKPKDEQTPFEEVIKGAWAVVAHDSMAAVDAARLGIPVFCTAENAARDVANFDLADIEKPTLLDREQWLWNLAYQQFTLKEIAYGEARDLLFSPWWGTPA